jgi:RNA chaperone Hfq
VTDPKAEDAEAGDPQLPPVPKNEQFAGLNRLRRERTWVDVFLIGGTCLHGQIRSFDASMMLLQTRSGDIGLYHHAISTVVRAQKRGGGKAFKNRENRDTRDNRDSRESRAPREARDARPLPPPRAHPSDPPDYYEPPRRPPERAPVVIVKQRRAKSVIKPQQD